ncbi:hypothetical protein ACFY3N_01595 [Streptomyces sp. NPDC000348]|uniref:hypothetical protein n=1 Tax=Streptomyces sp. NPDC000348 TaxID=3364538 RepID=UPI0036AD1A95
MSTPPPHGPPREPRGPQSRHPAHQVAYLEAARVLDTALDGAPGADGPGEDLTDDRQWAGRVEEALAEQTGLLRAHEWPAGAADAGACHGHEEKGRDLIDPHGSVTAREALGLATTPPGYEEDGRGTDSGELRV